VREMAATARLSERINMQGPKITRNHVRLFLRSEHSTTTTKVSEPLCIQLRMRRPVELKINMRFLLCITDQAGFGSTFSSCRSDVKEKTGQDSRRPCTSHSTYHPDSCRCYIIHRVRADTTASYSKWSDGPVRRCLDPNASP
jgi:hypothetical protein